MAKRQVAAASKGSNVQAKAPETAAPIAPKASNLAPVTAELALAVATSFAALATDDAKASATFAARAGLIADALGTPMTYAQWDKQVAPSVRDAFEGSGLTPNRVSAYAAKFKVIALARLTGDASLAPIAGEPMECFLSRVRPLLEAFKLADGSPMIAPSVTGKATSKRGRKPGTKASNAKAPGSAGRAETPTDAPVIEPAKSAALNLMKGDAAAAERLLTIVTKHRKAFDDWSAKVLADAATASAVIASAGALARAKAPGKPNGAAVN
jgi:hypothetical protein